MPRLSSSPLIHFNKNMSHHVECLANALVIDYADEGIILKKNDKKWKESTPDQKISQAAHVSLLIIINYDTNIK